MFVFVFTYLGKMLKTQNLHFAYFCGTRFRSSTEYLEEALEQFVK